MPLGGGARGGPPACRPVRCGGRQERALGQTGARIAELEPEEEALVEPGGSLLAMTASAAGEHPSLPKLSSSPSSTLQACLVLRDRQYGLCPCR